MSNVQIKTRINPVRLFEWDLGPLDVTLPKNPTLERLLEFLCTHDIDPTVKGFRQRYRAISKKDQHLVYVPESPVLVANLFRPLYHAKSSYLLGDFVGTIALCGLVAEKVAILIHQIHVDDKTARAAFEKLDQWRRVESLKEKSIITADTVVNFGRIKSARKKYLHYWIDPSSRISNEAINAYDAAIRLVLAALGLNNFESGKVKLSPKVATYLMAVGVIREGNGQ